MIDSVETNLSPPSTKAPELLPLIKTSLVSDLMLNDHRRKFLKFKLRHGSFSFKNFYNFTWAQEEG